MLDHSFGLPDMAALIEEAVRHVLRAGLRTADIAEPGVTIVGCEAMGDAIAAALYPAFVIQTRRR